MDGCNHYRFRIPFEAMREKVEGGYFDWAPIGKVREWAASGSLVKPTDYDIMLLPRHRPLPYGYKDEHDVEDIPDEMWQSIKELGVEVERKSHLLDLVRVLRIRQAVVLEYDDDYWTDSRDLGYDYQDLLRQLLAEVDAVTVSTPHLRKLVQRYAPGVPVYVLPNCVMWGEWQDRERWDTWPEDSVVLGLTGSQTHHEDWRVLEAVLPRVLNKYGQVCLLVGGFTPDYLEGLKDQFPDRVVFAEARPYGDYPEMVRQSDITLCPVIPDDEFNLSKSAIKAIEGMAASRPVNGHMGGSVPITSDLYYYRRVTGGHKRGLTIPHTEDAWYEAITTLVTDDDKRMRMAKKGRSWVHQNRRIETQWSLWWDAYRGIHRRRKH
jgi:glycosyltransferase involved in cell wall biosynthesis